MKSTRYVFALAALAVLPSSALGEQAPSYTSTGGQPREAVGVFCVGLNGVHTDCGGVDGAIPAGSPFSATTVGAVLFSVDTTGYQSAAVQVTGTFVGTVIYETSNDNSTWTSIAGYTPLNTGTLPPTTVDIAVSMRVFPLVARYFRARVSAYTSGTITVAPVLRRAPIPPLGVVATIAPYRTSGLNRSATVATTAGTLMPLLGTRQGWKIKNDCANPIWINFDGTAAATPGSGNIKIAPGGYLASEPGFVETGAMSAIAETSACAVTAREH